MALGFRNIACVLNPKMSIKQIKQIQMCRDIAGVGLGAIGEDIFFAGKDGDIG